MALTKSTGAQWWFVNVVGSLAGKFLWAIRAARRVAPADAPEGSRPGTAAAPSGGTELGALLLALFPPPDGRRYEAVLVEKRGLRTRALARALTPAGFKHAAAEARLSRGHMVRLRDALAPDDEEERALYPLFAPF